jgi:hypothetical protein
MHFLVAKNGERSEVLSVRRLKLTVKTPYKILFKIAGAFRRPLSDILVPRATSHIVWVAPG